jgi:hypothetical protein
MLYQQALMFIGNLPKKDAVHCTKLFITFKLENFRPGAVFTPIIPATGEAEIESIVVKGQPRENISKTPSQQISMAWWHMLSSQMCRRPSSEDHHLRPTKE